MSNLTTQTETRRDARKKNKRRPIIAFALATLAVGGVGAALTSAAWTDNVFFSASADAATFDLQGSLDGTDWKQSDNKEKIELVVPATAFAKLLPGETRTVTLYVKNLGNVSAKLASSVEWSSATNFVVKPEAAVSDLATTLTPATTKGDSDAFTLTVKAPSDWKPDNKGKAGTIIVTISGEATS
ncbi:hypothetical protein [Microbacterium sp. RU33B]|uniref:hypothetical protein n=1 Tax=Microbacterium sp. RU33B TaxID=1907390 RepID=UPI00096393DF|nr:hypothetical protein [Microbacterium sp. RU33B]SIT76448.1 hypothetical protein SAMN05880545_1595 [Microbacterium sp. RU33B]